MPAIGFEYDAAVFDDGAMNKFGQSLDRALRDAIRYARPSVNHAYKVFVRGNPQGCITFGVPALEIVVRYHAEWEFSKHEFALIGQHLAGHVRSKLNGLGEPVEDVKIRFYIENGYQGFEV
jgi:hypothetical protein